MNALDQLVGKQVTVRTYEDDIEGELVETGEDGVLVKETRLNDAAARWESHLIYIDRLAIRFIEGAWS